jgi:integrase
MPVRRTSDGRWRYRHVVQNPDGTRERLSGSAPTHINTKVAAERAMLDHIERVLHPQRVPTRKETPTFEEWFNGRFWDEHVLGRKNKPSEMREKKVIYECYLRPRFGRMPLDEITTAEVARFRAYLIALEKPRVTPKPGVPATKKLGEKRINNILAVLSKALKYAVDAEVLAKAPKIGMFKVERPEIVAWDFEQYARYAAVCLAGEAGLRVGEIKALRWREDVDMIARTITVKQQTCRGETGTPKGRTRRMVPMTTTLYEALKRMSVIREGFVIRNLDGTAKTDTQAVRAIERLCRKAGLPVRLWHTLRHAFGTTPRCSA